MTDTARTDTARTDTAVTDTAVTDTAVTDTAETDTDRAEADPELRERVVEGIRLLLPRVLKRDVPPPAENVCLFDELGLTSAGTLELILELEDHLDIQVDVEGIDQDDLRSLGTLAGFVAGHVLDEE